MSEKIAEPKTERTTGKGWRVINWRYLAHPHEAISSFVYILTLFIGVILLALLGSAIWGSIQLTASGAAKGEDYRAIIFATGSVIAAPFVIWRLYTSHIQAMASREQARTAQETHFTSLFTKAVEQLGATRDRRQNDAIFTEPNIELRLGAIYALERIAQDSERDCWPIIEALCAYARANAPVPRHFFFAHNSEEGEANYIDNDVRAWLSKLRPMDATVQAAIRVVCRLPRENSKRLDLRFVNFSDAELNGLSFENSDFDNSVFDRTLMSGVNFSNASFRNSIMHYVHAPNSNFSNADFFETLIQRPQFSQAYFNSAKLVETQLNMLKGDWQDEAPKTLLTRVDFSNADLTNASLHEADFTFSIGLEQQQVDMLFSADGSTFPEWITFPVE